MDDTITTRQLPFITGVNHRTGTLGLRDQLFVEDTDVPGVLARLQEAGLQEAMVLSTCDRVEVHATADNPDIAAQKISDALAAHAGIPGEQIAGQLYLHQGEAAIRHAFRVTASLESQIIGEPQILGQVKASHRMAREAGLIGRTLEPLYQAAYAAAKRVRHETAIGERPVTIAAASVELIRGLHGDLSRLNALLIGVGEMGEIIATQLKSAGLIYLTVTHPMTLRASNIARNLECHVEEYENLSSALTNADIVLCALGRRHHVLTADMVRAALKKRRYRPVFFVDAAVPGDIEPAVTRLDDAFVYDLNDLERVALEGLASREQEADIARQIVEDEIEKYMGDQNQRTVAPLISQLRQHVEALRVGALNEAQGDAEKATRLLMNRLLHSPSEILRVSTSNPEGPEKISNIAEAARKLFGLNEESEK